MMKKPSKSISLQRKIQKVMLKIKDTHHLINIDDIAFVKAEGSYSVIFLECGSKLILSKTLKEVELLINNNSFSRCHNSYFINILHVGKFNCKLKTLSILNNDIPVSRRKWSSTINKIKLLNTKYFNLVTI